MVWTGLVIFVQEVKTNAFKNILEKLKFCVIKYLLSTFIVFVSMQEKSYKRTKRNDSKWNAFVRTEDISFKISSHSFY